MCPFKTLPLPPPLPLPPLLPPTLMLPEVLPHAFPPPTNLPVCSFCRLLGPRALLGFDTQTVHTKGGFSLPLYLNTKISHVHRKGHQGCPVQDHFLFFLFLQRPVFTTPVPSCGSEAEASFDKPVVDRFLGLPPRVYQRHGL